MDACDLKKYILENDKIEYILEKLDCCNIRESKKEYRCSSVFSDNSSALVVKKDGLSVVSYSPNNEFRGDIFTLVMKVKNKSFYESVKYMHDILNLKHSKHDSKKTNNKVDILKVFKNASKRKKYNNDDKLEIYEESICDEYIKIPYIEWVREGIIPNTQHEFGVGYSVKNNRVVIPHRYWCGNGKEYVGIIGRTLNENFKILEIPKYFPLKAFPKTKNIYGLYENYEHIQEAGYVNIFESEKSTMKRHSRLDKTGVSLGCHEISIEQAKILISLNVDIIVQMDNDIDINNVRKICELFYEIRNVYYVVDEWGVLGEKESPADKPNKVYNFLWNRKIKYDKTEHEKYIKWKENNTYGKKK